MRRTELQLPPSAAPRRLRARRQVRAAIYVEVLISIIPVMIFFLGLIQLALIFTAQLIVRHAASRAARSAVVVLEDDPQRYDETLRGEVKYHSSQANQSGGRTTQFFDKLGDVIGVKLPTAEVNDMLSSEAGPRLVPIKTAAYMALAALAPSPQTLFNSLGLDGDSLSKLGNGARFLAGLFVYNRAAAMVTLRDANGEVTEKVDSTDEVRVRVTYLYYCGIPIVNRIMCQSLLGLSGLDQLDDVARNAYESVRYGGIAGVQSVKDNLQSDLQKISDQAGDLARDLQYAESPELLLPFMYGKARFKMLSAEMSLPNQGACYYEGSSCYKGAGSGSGSVDDASGAPSGQGDVGGSPP